MDLQEFSKVNRERCTSESGFNHTLDSWSPSEWTNAICGELGEAANLTKKILRHDQGIRGNVKPEDQDRDALRLRAIDEIADVIIYADLAIQALGGDTASVVRDKFNRKSAEIGCGLLV
jgi:NTP pyrophosphatase (non-canonical NTP hydrolase)